MIDQNFTKEDISRMKIFKIHRKRGYLLRTSNCISGGRLVGEKLVCSCNHDVFRTYDTGQNNLERKIVAQCDACNAVYFLDYNLWITVSEL